MFHKIKAFFTHSDRKLRDDRWIFTSMLVGAICSLIASFVLSTEAIQLAANADAPLSCNFSAVLNCGTVGIHPSAHILGFPNSFLGLIAEPVVITVAIAGLARIKFPRRFMFVAQICYTLGFMFALWLFYMSYVVIGALCPWCLLVTATTTFVWFAITRYNIRERNLYLPNRISHALQAYVERGHDKVLMAAVVMILIVLILVKYGPYMF